MLTATIQSGIDVIDQRWDGLARGAAYLLYGRARSGRDLVAMQIAAAAAAFDERCVFVSPRHPRELARQAAPTGFDLEAACAEGTLRLLRTPTSLGDGDDAIEHALDELLALVQRTTPDRLVIEDFTPFVLFRHADRLERTLRPFFEALADTETTAVIGLGEPASPSSEEIIAALRHLTAGAVHLAFDNEDTTARRLTLLPPPGALDAPSQHTWDLDRLKPGGLAAAAALFDEPEPVTEPPADDTPVGAPESSDAPKPQQAEASDAPAFSGDGAIAPAAIHFFDLDTPRLDAPAPDTDPFADLSAALVETGHLVEGATAASETPQVAEAPRNGETPHASFDPFATAEIEITEFRPEDFELDAFEPEPAEAEPTEAEGTGGPALGEDVAQSTAEPSDAAWCSIDTLTADAEAEPEPAEPEPAESVSLETRFAEAFDAARAETHPFLALALRTDAEPVFAALAEALAHETTDEAHLLADANQRRLAVLLPGRTADEAPAVFRRLRDHLAATPGLDAAAALRAVTAVVAPDGRPFADADAFLAHALGA